MKEVTGFIVSIGCFAHKLSVKPSCPLSSHPLVETLGVNESHVMDACGDPHALDSQRQSILNVANKT